MGICEFQFYITPVLLYDINIILLTIIFFVTAYGKVFLVRKRVGVDEGKLYAMKVLKKASIVQKLKTAEHTRTERQVRFTLMYREYMYILR